MSLTAEIVAIGDELIAGATVDTNSGWIARALEKLAIRNVRTQVVGDDEDETARAIVEAAERADVVLVIGGLGPTEDDRARHAVARAVGAELVHSDEAFDQVRAWYARAGREMPDTNRRQALLPQGAAILRNARGTAPGFALEFPTARGGRLIASLPGPPGEMSAMFESEVLPRLAERARRAGGGTAMHRFQLLGLSESVFAERVGDWMARDANPLIGSTVSQGVLTATLRARGADEAEARAALDARVAEFRPRFAEWTFREMERDESPRIEDALGPLLIERGLAFTAAESCTAGLIAARLARVPGISAVLGASFVTYSDDAKRRLVGVRPETLAAHGAVSAETAAEMAAGAAAAADARVSVAVSGIAGPGGGTAEKPVGTVAFATSVDGAVEAEVRRFPPTARDAIRDASANVALVLLWRRLTS